MVEEIKRVVHYTSCPVCGSRDINPLLTVRDHSVSGEDFVIWQCSHCQLRFTQDVPDEPFIGPYYQSPDYISHSNTNRGLINKLYQAVRTFTLERKADLVITKTVKKGKILDLGAGTGAFLHTMKKKGWDVTGIEPDAGARQQASNLFGIDLRETAALSALEPGSFDAITLWHVLEHVHSLHAYLEQLKSLLKANGKLIIAVPNYESTDSSVYQLYWAAYDVPRHLYHFTPKTIKMLVEKHGMELAGKKPMWFDSFYISLLSSRYKNGKSRWAGAVLTGLRSNLKALFNKDYCSSLIYIISKT